MALITVQWIQDVQKPLAGFLWRLNQPKDEEIRPPPFSSFNLAETGSPKCTIVCLNQEHAPKCVFKPSLEHISKNGANRRTVNETKTPNRQAVGHMDHMTACKRLGSKSKWGYATYRAHGCITVSNQILCATSV
jgi:hypothetical protein